MRSVLRQFRFLDGCKETATRLFCSCLSNKGSSTCRSGRDERSTSHLRPSVREADNCLERASDNDACTRRRNYFYRLLPILDRHDVSSHGLDVTPNSRQRWSHQPYLLPQDLSPPTALASESLSARSLLVFSSRACLSARSLCLKEWLVCSYASRLCSFVKLDRVLSAI